MHPQNKTFWRVCLPASMFTCGYIYACKDTYVDPLLPHKAQLHKQKVRHFRWCFCVFTGWWKGKCNLAIWLKERCAHTHTPRDECIWQHLSSEIKDSYSSIHIQTEQQGKWTWQVSIHTRKWGKGSPCIYVCGPPSVFVLANCQNWICRSLKNRSNVVLCCVQSKHSSSCS